MNMEYLKSLQIAQKTLFEFDSNEINSVCEKIYNIYHNKLNVKTISADLFLCSFFRPEKYQKLIELTKYLFNMHWSDEEKEVLLSSHKNQFFRYCKKPTISFKKYSNGFNYQNELPEGYYGRFWKRGDDENSDYMFINNDNVDSLIKASSLPSFDIENVYKVNGIPMTLITVASFFGYVKCFKFLLLNYAKIQKETVKYAIAGGNIEIIKLIGESGFSMSEYSDVAVAYHRYNIFEWLFDGEVNEGQIKAALSNGNITSFLYMYEKKKFNAAEYVEENTTIHFINALNLSKSTCNKVIDGFARITDIDVLDACLEKGGDINHSDDEGDTPLIVCVMHYDKFATKTVYERGGNPNAKNNFGDTPLLCAISTQMIDMVMFLVDELNVDVKNSDVFGTACSSGSLEIVKYLATKPNVDINYLSEDRMTPLLLAAERHRIDIIPFLLKLPGINLEARNSFGKDYKWFLD